MSQECSHLQESQSQVVLRIKSWQPDIHSYPAPHISFYPSSSFHNLRSSWLKKIPMSSLPTLQSSEVIRGNCAKFCFNVKCLGIKTFFQCFDDRRQTVKSVHSCSLQWKKILLIRALAIQWCAMMCICSCLLLYSVALRRGADHDLIQQIFISRPCSLVFEDVFMSISESRNDHYEAPGIDLVAVGRDILQNSHLTAVTKEKCSLLPSTLCPQVGPRETPSPCLNRTPFCFVDYILRCNHCKEEVHPILGNGMQSWWNLACLQIRDSQNLIKRKQKQEANRFCFIQCLNHLRHTHLHQHRQQVDKSIASTGHQEGSTQKPFSEHLKRWMLPMCTMPMLLQHPTASFKPLQARWKWMTPKKMIEEPLGQIH